MGWRLVRGRSKRHPAPRAWTLTRVLTLSHCLASILSSCSSPFPHPFLLSAAFSHNKHTHTYTQVCDAIELSRKTLSKIQQNLGWAFCYNLVGIPLAAGALLPKYGLALTPSVSGALMGFSSLAVMANSLVLQWEVRGLRNGLVTAQQHDARAASVSAASKVGRVASDGGSSGSSSSVGLRQQPAAGSSLMAGSATTGVDAV